MAERTKRTHDRDARNKPERRARGASPKSTTGQAQRSKLEGCRAYEAHSTRSPDAGTDKRSKTGRRRVGGRTTSTVRRGPRNRKTKR